MSIVQQLEFALSAFVVSIVVAFIREMWHTFKSNNFDIGKRLGIAIRRHLLAWLNVPTPEKKGARRTTQTLDGEFERIE